ncbi:hypothetical protein D3C80_1768930 [compost metagenome]
MYHVGLFVQGISGSHFLGDAIDGEAEAAGKYVGQLFVRVAMQRADSTLAKVDLHRHHGAAMSEDTACHAVP